MIKKYLVFLIYLYKYIFAGYKKSVTSCKYSICNSDKKANNPVIKYGIQVIIYPDKKVENDTVENC